MAAGRPGLDFKSVDHTRGKLYNRQIAACLDLV